MPAEVRFFLRGVGDDTAAGAVEVVCSSAARSVAVVGVGSGVAISSTMDSWIMSERRDLDLESFVEGVSCVGLVTLADLLLKERVVCEGRAARPRRVLGGMVQCVRGN